MKRHPSLKAVGGAAVAGHGGRGREWRGAGRQRGAFLVLAAILIAALLGITALGIDVGRAYALRSEMQNAVDAAALAAAAELDAGPDARERARSAARHLLQHDSRFASVAALLGEDALPDEAFTFYCLIGAKYDPPFSTTFCSNDEPDAEGRYFASSDAEAHYVRIHLNPALAEDRFRIGLNFLPVLSALGVPTSSQAQLQAHGMGGRNFYTCNVVPMAICDPFEGSGTTFKDAMRPGDTIQLRGQGGSSGGNDPTHSQYWAPGDFGFLSPPDGGTGANDLADFLANESSIGCAPPYARAEPGQKLQKTTEAINTRFDQYKGGKDPWEAAPPAPYITDFPHASGPHPSTTDSRFGNNIWDVASFWTSAGHTGAAPAATATRYQAYQHAIATDDIPAAAAPDPDHVSSGSVPERRVLTIAVLSCDSMGMQGRGEGPIRSPDGFARLFLYRQADGPPDAAIWGEYIDWEDAGNDKFHVDIQLYE